MGMSTVHHWNLHKMMLKKLHTLWAMEPFYMVHSYVNISITKTTTYVFFLSFLIVVLVRGNERNVGLRSLFHMQLISKKPTLAFIYHFLFSFWCGPPTTLYSIIYSGIVVYMYNWAYFSLSFSTLVWGHVNENNENCVWISIFIYMYTSMPTHAACAIMHNSPGESVGAHSVQKQGGSILMWPSLHIHVNFSYLFMIKFFSTPVVQLVLDPFSGDVN